jgi:hypothetical protein
VKVSAGVQLLALGLVWQAIAAGFDRPVDARGCGSRVWVREAGGTAWIVDRGVRRPSSYRGSILCPKAPYAVEVRGDEVGRWVEPAPGALPEVRIGQARAGDDLVLEALVEGDGEGLSFAWSFDDGVERAGRRVLRDVAATTVFLRVTAPGRTPRLVATTVRPQGSR